MMVDAGSLRDSTQIVLPAGTLSGVRDDLEDRFVVTVMDEGDTVRIIGSPVIIKDVNNYLCRQGINVP